jgi:hypothetical protein
MILRVIQGNKNKLFWTLHLFCTSHFNSGALEVILYSDTEMAGPALGPFVILFIIIE